MERSIDYDRRVAPWSGLGTDISEWKTAVSVFSSNPDVTDLPVPSTYTS